MKSRVVKLYDYKSISIPAEMCDWQLDEADIDARINGLAMEFAQEAFVETVAEGDCVFCRAAENGPMADRTVLLFPGRAIPGAEEAEKAIVGKNAGERVVVTLAGAESELTIEKIQRYMPAVIDDKLIQKLAIDGVHTIADYRTYFRNERERSNKSMAAGQIATYMLQKLIEHSEFAIDSEEMNVWTGKRAEQMFQYMLEEGEDPRLPEEGFDILTDEQAIAKIAKSLESNFKETLVCREFCAQNGIRFTAEDVQAELEQYKAAGMAEMVDEDQLIGDKYFLEVLNALENKAKTFLEG